MVDSSPGAPLAAPLGLLLLHQGEPASEAQVVPFLTRAYRDPRLVRPPGGWLGRTLLARLLASRAAPPVAAGLRALGGRSPLLVEMEALGQELATALFREGLEVRVGLGLRWGEPGIESAARSLVGQGVRGLLALSLHPQRCRAHMDGAQAALERALGGESPQERLRVIGGFATQPEWIEALSEAISKALDGLPPASRVLFCAHSLPLPRVHEGDPYPEQVQTTARAVMALVDDARAPSTAAPTWAVGYQSRVGLLPWLGPGVEDLLDVWGAQQVPGVLCVPLSSLVEGLGTRYELDQLFSHKAAEAGIGAFRRLPAGVGRERWVAGLGSTLGAVARGEEEGDP